MFTERFIVDVMWIYGPAKSKQTRCTTAAPHRRLLAPYPHTHTPIHTAIQQCLLLFALNPRKEGPE